MSARLEQLKQDLASELGERIVSVEAALGELTLTIRAADCLSVAERLRDRDRKSTRLNSSH